MRLESKQRIDWYVGGALILLLKPVGYALGLLLRRDHDRRPQGEILVVKMLGGGSILMAFPSLLGIRKEFPEARFKILTTPAVAPFARMLKVFDEIIVLDDRGLATLFKSLFAAFPRIFRVDTTLDLEVYSRLTSVISTLTLARNRFTFYFQSVFWRKNLHTHLVYFNQSFNVCAFYDRMATALGAQPETLTDSGMFFKSSLPAPMLREPGFKLFTIGHVCSEQGRERMLTALQWADLLRVEITDTKAQLLFLGAKADHGILQSLLKDLSPRFPEWKLQNCAGEITLEEAASEIGNSDRFIGIDSSLLHVARLLGTPTLSVWGPTSPATRLRDYPRAGDQVIYKPTPCSPCIHVAEKPPCGGNNVCIARIFDPKIEASSSEFVPVITS